jgi:hypothetical protein
MIQNTHNGAIAFDKWLTGFQAQLSAAQKQKNPALHLYKNGARTNLFMLQGLARIYKNIHNAKRFTKMQTQFKYYEDAIGTIDYYFSFYEMFSKNKLIPKDITALMQDVLAQEYDELNNHLQKKIFDKPNFFDKKFKKIDSAKWLEDADETKALKIFYKTEIEKVNKYITDLPSTLTDMEVQVHELRRKMRWLSIYPQALCGKVQLAIDAKPNAILKKYATPEIVKSGFNKMPTKGKNKTVVHLNKANFLALSNVIAQLGSIKDKGLALDLLEKMNLKLLKNSPDEASKNATIYLKCDKNLSEKLLLEAHQIIKDITKDKVLQGLLSK